jgi:hypothetical protein
LSDVELIAVCPVTGHQEPARQARLHVMEMGTDGRLRELAQHDVKIAVETAPQGEAVLDLTAK